MKGHHDCLSSNSQAFSITEDIEAQTQTFLETVHWMKTWTQLDNDVDVAYSDKSVENLLLETEDHCYRTYWFYVFWGALTLVLMAYGSVNNIWLP